MENTKTIIENLEKEIEALKLEKMGRFLESKMSKEITNATYALYNNVTYQVEILIDFIEQNGLDEKLMDHMKDIASNEKMPIYQDAAKVFTEEHEEFLFNNYQSNKEMLKEGSEFLLEPEKPLLDVNKDIKKGEIPIIIHDRLYKHL